MTTTETTTKPTTETPTEMTTEATESTETFDPAAWEEQLIADMRAHGGEATMGPVAGHPLLLLYTTGAKTGQRRRSVLTYSRDGDDLIVAGTAGGSKTTPAWVVNLERRPDVEIEVRNETYPVKATVYREGPERDRLWNQHVEQLPWFADYPNQVGDRIIPMVRLSRAA